MPHKHEKEKVLLKREKDRRVKLTHEQRQEIKENKLGLSQRSLAIKYNVSRRLISFILDPAKQIQNLEKRKERGGSKKYYDKEKHKEYMKNHRHYKKEQYEKGGTYNGSE